MVNVSLKKLDNITKKGDTYPIKTKHTNGIKIMKTIYVLTAWNTKRHGCNIQPFNTAKQASKKIDDLSNKGFNEFLLEKRKVSK